MGKEREGATLTLDVAGAEDAVAQARLTLDAARHASAEAEEAFRARQADEAAALQSYEQAAQGVRDAFAEERARIEEQMRTAERELKALEAKLSDLDVGSTSAPMATNPISFESSGNQGEEIGKVPDAAPDRDAAVPDRDRTAEGSTDDPAYEDDWYRTLKQNSEKNSLDGGA